MVFAGGMQPAIGVQRRSPHLTARRLQLCYFALKKDFTLARGFVCSPDPPSRNPCCALGCAGSRQICHAVCWPPLPWGLAPTLSLHPSYTQAGSLWAAAWKAPDLPFCATLFSMEPAYRRWGYASGACPTSGPHSHEHGRPGLTGKGDKSALWPPRKSRAPVMSPMESSF